MKKAIVFKSVKKNFGKLEALKGIDLTIEEGEFFGLLGPNGAGKSTLINILAGLTKPSSGSIKVMGYDVTQDYQYARRSLGIVPQELVFDPFFNVREMLRFQAGYFGKGQENDDWIDEVIEELDLKDKANTNMRMLSGGMKRRALIAQALVHKPPVIVLDEPTRRPDEQPEVCGTAAQSGRGATHQDQPHHGQRYTGAGQERRGIQGAGRLP